MRTYLSSTHLRLALVGAVLVSAIVAAACGLVTTRRSNDLAESRRAASAFAQVLAEQTSRTIQPVDLTLRAIQERAMNIAEEASSSLSRWRSTATFDWLTEQLKNLPQVDALLVVGG